MDALLNNSLPPPHPGNIFPKGPGQEGDIWALPSDSGETGLSFSLSLCRVGGRGHPKGVVPFCGAHSCGSGVEALCLLGSWTEMASLLHCLQECYAVPS